MNSIGIGLTPTAMRVLRKAFAMDRERRETALSLS